MHDKERTWACFALNVLALVWIGMIVGVSFLATPAKFLAPSLSLPVALDVGRQTFGVFSLVEVAGAAALFAAVLLSRRRSRMLLLAGLTGLLVAFQFIWLLPALDARVEIILQGGTPAASSLHTLYVVFEVAKLLLLGLIVMRSYASINEPQEL